MTGFGKGVIIDMYKRDVGRWKYGGGSMKDGKNGIFTAVVWHSGRKRIFCGISEEAVRTKVDGYLTRCDYQGERCFVADGSNETHITV